MYSRRRLSARDEDRACERTREAGVEHARRRRTVSVPASTHEHDGINNAPTIQGQEQGARRGERGGGREKGSPAYSAPSADAISRSSSALSFPPFARIVSSMIERATEGFPEPAACPSTRHNTPHRTHHAHNTYSSQTHTHQHREHAHAE